MVWFGLGWSCVSWLMEEEDHETHHRSSLWSERLQRRKSISGEFQSWEITVEHVDWALWDQRSYGNQALMMNLFPGSAVLGVLSWWSVLRGMCVCERKRELKKRWKCHGQEWSKGWCYYIHTTYCIRVSHWKDWIKEFGLSSTVGFFFF